MWSFVVCVFDCFAKTGKTEWAFDVKETDTIGDIKVMLQGKEVLNQKENKRLERTESFALFEGIEPEKQKLVFSGKNLDDTKTAKVCVCVLCFFFSRKKRVGKINRN